MTWNPVTGCTKIGPGCDNCYAERFAERWRGMPAHPYEQGFDLRMWPSRLEYPRRWKKPRMIFVNSMSDLFHKSIDSNFIDRVFDAMENANWHIFRLLTKRSSLLRCRVRRRYHGGMVPDHIWLGVSVEDAKRASRILHLNDIPCAVRFVSFEPLFGPLGKVKLKGLYQETAQHSTILENGQVFRFLRFERSLWGLQLQNRSSSWLLSNRS